MEKIKDMIKNNKCVELSKLILISFICIYSFLSVINTLELIKEYNEINESIKHAEEYFEQDLKTIEEDIVYTNIESQQEEHSTNKMSYFELKYPNAMYVLTQKGSIIGELTNILITSICMSIFIGLIIFIYKNTSKISILTIVYIVTYSVVWIILDNIDYIMPTVKFEFEKGGYIFSNGFALSSDEQMILFSVLMTAFVFIKTIKNKIIINKLNELVKNDK